MADVWMVSHKMTWLNQQIRNVYYYEETVGAPSASEWQDIVDEIRSELVSYLQTYMCNVWSFTGIDYRLVSTPGLPTFSVTPTSGALVGSDSSDPTASQICMLVSAKANTVKPNHVRTYLAGWAADRMTFSLWQSTPMGAAETFVDYQSVLNGGGTNPLERVSAQWNSTHTQVVAYHNVSASASVASQVPATQRRRRIGVGI